MFLSWQHNWEYTSSCNYSMIENQVKGYNNWNNFSVEERCNTNNNIVEKKNYFGKKRKRTDKKTKEEELGKQTTIHIVVVCDDLFSLL